ncbi:MAG: hypothetical protein ACR2FY_06270 [Pirellulaceae bacterium]
MKYSLRSLMIAVALRLVLALPIVLAAIYLLANESRWQARVFLTTEAVFFSLLALYVAWNSVHKTPAKNPPRSSQHEAFSRICFWLLLAITAGDLTTLAWIGFNRNR